MTSCWFEGSRSIKVQTQGLHEGGRIEYKTPMELVEPTVDANEYLQFVLSFATYVRADVASFIGPGFGVTSAPGVSALPAVGSYYYEEETPTRPKVNSVRVVLESVDGKTVDATADVPTEPDEGWYKVAIPFKVLGLKKGDSFKVARILFFTDVAETVYVGKIGTINDATPINVQNGDEQVVAVNDTVTFRGDADSGVSMLRYTWNFGDHGEEDDLGVDATGQMVSHVFRKGGELNVLLTVSDIWGIKAPVTTAFKVSVND
jgi:hypothetical protein